MVYKCSKFACVYATKNGCSIKGWIDAEGELNGKKGYCNFYDVMCISAKCRACAYLLSPDCQNVKE
jgi:hypothetical protein